MDLLGNNEAEIQAMYRGVQLCLSLDLKQVLVQQSDSISYWRVNFQLLGVFIMVFDLSFIWLRLTPSHLFISTGNKTRLQTKPVKNSDYLIRMTGAVGMIGFGPYK